MKHLLITLVAILFSINEGFSQAQISISDAVNVAGRQRTLSQRMAKNKVYLAAHKNTKNAKLELKYTIYAFENGLKTLKDFAPTNAIKSKVEAEEFAFEKYKKEILNNSETSLKEVINTNTTFLNICDELVAEIIKYTEKEEIQEKYITTKIPETTSIVAELRYLTQRLTLYYALNDFEIQKISPSEIDSIVKTLDKDIDYLTILEFNTVKIDEEINDIRIDWIKLKKGIYNNEHVDLDKHKISAIKLYKMCNEILDKANITSRMYNELNKS